MLINTFTEEYSQLEEKGFMKKTVMEAMITASILMLILSVSTVFAAPAINLPPGPVDAQFYHPYGDISYWRVVLSDVPDGYDVADGTYVGWCVDKEATIPDGAKLQDVMLYSSYDSGMPTACADPDWPKVNYILNNKQGTWEDVADAIWWFIGGGSYPTDDDAKAMVTAADANAGFEPGPAQILAVIVYKAGYQITCIEVINIDGVIPEYPVGPIVASTSFVLALGLFKYRDSLPAVSRLKRQ